MHRFLTNQHSSDFEKYKMKVMEKRNGLVEFPVLGHEQESSPVGLLFNNNRGNISAGALVKSRYKFLIYHG